MSAIDLALRNASRKRSVPRFSEPNSNSLVMNRVQVRTEQTAKPPMITWATLEASRNIWKGVSLPAFLMWTGSGGASVAEAGAASEAAGAEDAAADDATASAAGGVCAKAGVLAISAKAPSRAMKGVFLWLSNICRQFLIGVARVGRGSSVCDGAPVTLCPTNDPEVRGVRRTAVAAPDPLCFPGRRPARVACRRRVRDRSHRNGPGPSRHLDVRLSSFGNPFRHRQVR